MQLKIFQKNLIFIKLSFEIKKITRLSNKLDIAVNQYLYELKISSMRL